MERNYFIPIAVAAALHSMIFISDQPTPVPPGPSKPEQATKWEEVILPPLDDLVPISSDGESSTPSEKPPPPGGMENMTTAPSPDDFIQVVKLLDLRPRVGPDVGAIDPNWQEALAGNSGASGPISFVGLDNIPETRFQPAPAYPSDLKSTGMDGMATVSFSVDVNGQVFDAVVSHASNSRFGEEAVRAVRRWRFEPGIKDGKRVAFRMVQNFTFTLSN